MVGNDDIECPDCDGNGFIPPHKRMGEFSDCPDCDGRGWRPMTDEERDNAAADAFSDMCEGEPPITMDERHAMAWREKQGVR